MITLQAAAKTIWETPPTMAPVIGDAIAETTNVTCNEIIVLSVNNPTSRALGCVKRNVSIASETTPANQPIIPETHHAE